jgi:PKD repeat protein
MKTRNTIFSLSMTLIVIGLLFTLTCLKAQTLTTASFTYTVGSGGNVNFTSTSTNTTGLICTWRFGDGSLLSGNQTPSHTYSASGYYAVVLIIENSFGVIRDSTTKGIQVNTLLTDLTNAKAQAKRELNVSPLPAHQLITITYETNESSPPMITFIDMTGKVVKSFTADKSGTTLIQTSDLPAGVYVLQLHSSGGVLSKRVIIARD